MFSLRHMEQNVIDLNRIEAETKEKIAAVNSQKVVIVTAFMAQMKVWRSKLKDNSAFVRCCLKCLRFFHLNLLYLHL